MPTRQPVNLELDTEVADILHSYAAAGELSEAEIVEHAVRAYDLRSLLGRIGARSDLAEEEALALSAEELHAARAERDHTG